MTWVQHGPKQLLKVTIEKLAEKQRSTVHVSCTCQFEWPLNVEKFKSKQIQVSRPLGPWGRLEVQALQGGNECKKHHQSSCACQGLTGPPAIDSPKNIQELYTQVATFRNLWHVGIPNLGAAI